MKTFCFLKLFIFAFIFIFVFVGSMCISFAEEKTVIIEHKFDKASNQPFISEYNLMHDENDVINRRPVSAFVEDDSRYFEDANATFFDLALRVVLVIIFTLGFLFLVKYLPKAHFKNSTLNSKEIKSYLQRLGNKDNFLELKQGLVLAPGQVIYLVKTNDKNILLGSTPNGGVQYLTDLNLDKHDELDFKEIEKLQHVSKKEGFHINHIQTSSSYPTLANNGSLKEDLGNQINNDDVYNIFKTTNKNESVNVKIELNGKDKKLLHVGQRQFKNSSSAFRPKVKFSQTLLTSGKKA